MDDGAPWANGVGRAINENTIRSTFPISEEWAAEGWRIGVVAVNSEGTEITIHWVKEVNDVAVEATPGSDPGSNP